MTDPEKKRLWWKYARPGVVEKYTVSYTIDAQLYTITIKTITTWSFNISIQHLQIPRSGKRRLVPARIASIKSHNLVSAVPSSKVPVSTTVYYIDSSSRSYTDTFWRLVYVTTSALSQDSPFCIVQFPLFYASRLLPNKGRQKTIEESFCGTSRVHNRALSEISFPKSYPSGLTLRSRFTAEYCFFHWNLFHSSPD